MFHYCSLDPSDITIIYISSTVWEHSATALSEPKQQPKIWPSHHCVTRPEVSDKLTTPSGQTSQQHLRPLEHHLPLGQAGWGGGGFHNPSPGLSPNQGDPVHHVFLFRQFSIPSSPLSYGPFWSLMTGNIITKPLLTNKQTYIHPDSAGYHWSYTVHTSIEGRCGEK